MFNFNKLTLKSRLNSSLLYKKTKNNKLFQYFSISASKRLTLFEKKTRNTTIHQTFSVPII
jgi:hypothetical protein